MCRVLLVDDEYLEREALKIIISEGIEGAVIVGETGLGREAIELSKKLDPDIIFMDIKMPGINGIEATEMIKSKDRNKIIIILTAYDDFNFAQRAIKAGADDYILKPARTEEILETINRHMDKISIRKRSSIDERVQNLLKKIKSGDYKESKEILKSIIELYLDNIEELRTKAKELADQMIKTSYEMGLKVEKLFNNKIDYIYQLYSLNDIYSIEIWLLKILDAIFDEIMKKKTSDSSNELKLVLDYIEKNFYKGVTLEEVANYVGLSPCYLSKLFKRELEINFVTYVTECRIEKAKELLENTDMPVLNIALELGYNEPNYFSKVFKKIVHMTPSQYRERKRMEKAKKLKSNLFTKHVPVLNGKWYA